MRGDFHKAVTIPAVHSELLHVEVVRKGNRLGRLIANSRIFRSKVVRYAAGYRRAQYRDTHRQLPRKLIRPLREEVGHRSVGVSGFLRSITGELRETSFHAGNGNRFFEKQEGGIPTEVSSLGRSGIRL